MKSKSFITNSAKETMDLGRSFAKEVKPGSILVFFGNLGSGKTTFIQGLARGLGVKRRIISPTFIIIRHYRLETDRSFFYHIDLYRTETINDLIGLGLDQILKENNIVSIEWGEKLNGLLPDKRIEIKLKNINDKREILIEKYE